MISMAEDGGEGSKHGPDDLMEISIADLARLLMHRCQRLNKLEQTHAPACCIRREKQLIRIAATASRVRVREMAAYILNLLDE